MQRALFTATSPTLPLSFVAGLLACVALSLGGCKRAPAPNQHPTTDPASKPDSNPKLGTKSPASSPSSHSPAQLRLASLALPTRLSNRLDFDQPPTTPRPAQARAPSPMKLTAGDGSGLQLVRLVAKAVIDGPLAFTELHLRFRNPEPRQREGRFSITLPAGAAVSRFAMRRGRRWREGEVVEKQRARRVYEDFLHRKRDPALLEQDQGNVFSARVFPIEAGADKELIVSWSQELSDPKKAWSLPLRGLPQLDALQVEVSVHQPGAQPTNLGGQALDLKVVRLSRRNFQPQQDLIVWPGYLKSPWDALRQGRQVVVRVKPPGAAANDHFERLVVLFDTSASGAARWETRLRTLRDLLHFAARHGASEATVFAFDQEAKQIFEGDPASFGEETLARLRTRAPLGASDLGAALVAAREAWTATDKTVARDARETRVILFGDGVTTLGHRKIGTLLETAKVLTRAGAVRFDALTLASARDDALLKALSGAGKRLGVVLHIQDQDPHPFDRLALRTLDPIRVAIAGAQWVYPEVIEGLQAGQQTLVFAELPADQPLIVTLIGSELVTMRPKSRPGTGPLLDRAMAKAEIDRLLLDASTGARSLRQARRREALALSLQYRVLCPLTAMLVLETDADLARYGIRPQARAELLFVESPGQIGVRRPRADSAIDSVREGGAGRDQGLKSPPVAEIAAQRAPDEDEAMVQRPTRSRTTMAPKGEVAEERAKEAGALKAAAAAETAAAAAAATAAAAARVKAVPPTDEARIGSLNERQARDKDLHDRPMRKYKASPRPPRHQFSAESRLGATPSASAQGDARYGQGGRGRARQGQGKRGLKMTGRREETAAPENWRPDAPKMRRLRDTTVLFDTTLEDRAPAPKKPLVRPRPSLGFISPIARRRPRRSGRSELRRIEAAIAKRSPWRQDYRRVRELIELGRSAEALQTAWRWRKAQIGDVMALVALGDAARARADLPLARRAWGSIIDLYPARADTRRFAADLLQGLGDKGLQIAIDSLRVATLQRPDHPTGFHLLAMALAADGRYAQALDAVMQGLRSRHRGTARAIDRVLSDDAADIAATWAARDPGHRPTLERQLKAIGARWVSHPRLRVVLTWETDANDVDLHVFNAQNDHAWYKHRRMRRGRGAMYKSAFEGYGPEAFATSSAQSGPWRLFAYYYRMGPMGWGMGQAQVIRVDGAGDLMVQARPYVLQQDKAWIDLGSVPAELLSQRDRRPIETL